MLHTLSHWAYVEVLFLIIEHVRLMEWILQELALHLLVEHIVLHVRCHAVGNGFDFGAVYILHIKRYESFVMS